MHLLHRLDLHQALDRPLDHRVQPLDAGQRHVKFFKVDDRYKFIGLFVPAGRFQRQQALCNFGAPRVYVFAFLEGPFLANEVAVTEASEERFNLLPAGGLIKFSS